MSLTALVEALKTADFQVGAAPSFWRDIRVLSRGSERALSDIKSTIHGFAFTEPRHTQSREAPITSPTTDTLPSDAIVL
jgi:hypothetical protein